MDTAIIIVGAGPAGLSTALHLAQLAPELASRVLILERARHPRPKLCAGGLMPAADAWLRKLELDPRQVPSVEVRQVRFLFEGRGFVFRREPFVFRVVRRDEFDAWLANAARARGLALQEGVHVRSIRCLEDAVAVETDRGTFRALAVVGADGALSVVRRAIARPQTPHLARLLETLVPAGLQSLPSHGPLPGAERGRPPDGRLDGRPASGGECDGCPASAEATLAPPGPHVLLSCDPLRTAERDGRPDGPPDGRPASAGISRLKARLRPCFTLEPGPDQAQALFDFSCMALGVQGYVWDFPTQVRGQPMRTQGIFDSRARPQAPRPSLPLVLQGRLADLGPLPGDCRIMGHPVRWFHPRATFSALRVLLVGDAAGVDPLFGEGISFALGYGDAAARALRDAFTRGDFSFQDYRGRLLGHPVGRSLQRRAAAARLAYRIYNRRVLHFLWWNLSPLVGWLAEHLLVDWGH